MKVILITGLDGSGKSTLLARINEHSNTAHCKIINLPHIDTEPLNQHVDLHKTALFVNRLNHDADVLRLPQLKAVALFASMLLYGKILALIKQGSVKIVFCERHPLIDSGIYARFYARKLYPGSISEDILNELDEKYTGELHYLLKLLPENIITVKTGITSTLVEFIYKWFHQEKKYDTANLKTIFNTGFPDKIYYLQAAPEVLYNRIRNRKVLEAHESVEVFSRLDSAYHDLFNELNTNSFNLVEIIKTDNTENMNNLFTKLTRLIS